MNFFLVLLGVILSFFILCIFAHIRVEFVYNRSGENDHGHILFSVFKGLIHYRFEIKKINFTGIEDGVKVETKSEAGDSSQHITARSILAARHNYQELLQRISHFQGTIRWFLNKVTCEQFYFLVRIGTGDAVETGIVVGMAWGLISTIVGFFGRNIQWRLLPEIEVIPHFQQMKLESELHVIIRFRIGNAILGICRLLLKLRKKEVNKKWVNTLSRA